MRLMILAFALALCAGINVLLAEEQEPPIDWQRVQQLHQREQRGETLSAEDQACLNRAKKAIQQGQGPGQNPGGPGSNQGLATGGKDTVGLVPLSELGTGQYKGEDGGLYGSGSNVPPPEHKAAVEKELAQLRPLNSEGQPSPDGCLVLLSVGMSNTTQEFQQFKRLADADADKAPGVVIVDGAQGGATAARWTGGNKRIWDTVAERLKSAGVTAKQVQIVWIKQANANPSGEFNESAGQLKNDLIVDLKLLKQHFPSLRIAYLSSRIYAGYATTKLNPEPYAYEGAFAVRWLIQQQIRHDAQLNYDSARGEVTSPLLLWGPYLWADGQTFRKADGLTWERKDLSPGDGTHPSLSGAVKVAELLLKFLKTDPLAKTWFVKTGTETQKPAPEKAKKT